MNLPKDPLLLLSIVNMRLRDNDDSFEEMCHSADYDSEQVRQTLRQIGYIYSTEYNQFVRGDI